MFSLNVAINDGEFTKTIYSLVKLIIIMELHCDIVKFQIKDGQHSKAIQVLHGIPESNSCREGLSLLAYCYFYTQDFHNAANYYEQLTQIFPENDDYKLYHAQCLYQACLYDEAFNATETIENSEYKNQVTKLQAAIKYGQEDLISARNLVESCQSDDPDTDVNLACLLYKVRCL